MMNSSFIVHRSHLHQHASAVSFIIPMWRADLYRALAEALAEPPDWLALPGCEWPLFECAVRLAPVSEAARRGAEAMAEVRAASLAARRERYAALFVGSGRPRFWLYESAFLTGRLLGPATFAVEKLYRAAGLDPVGAELPDHASLELSFLAHLAEQPADGAESTGPNASTKSERDFIEQHAGRWLPDLGRALARSGDEIYAPIGQLLAEWLEERARGRVAGDKAHVILHHTSRFTRLPFIPQHESCSLCGFCVQVCPVHALAISETASDTALVLNAAACVGCGKCERVCTSGALTLAPSGDEQPPSAAWLSLRSSPRVICKGCGEPMTSCAELDFVAAQIGKPAWLAYCMECRPAILEMQR